MKKIFLVLALWLFVMVPNVQALSLENISVLDNSDSYKGGSPKIDGNGTKDVTITFDAAQLKVVKAEPSIGRTIDAAWVGVKVVAPKDIEIATLKNATYVNNGSASENSFWSNQDSKKTENKSDEHYINVFGAITETNLKTATEKGTKITYTWKFDWDNDKTDDQIVTIIVDPSNVSLTAKDNDDVLWNQETYNELKPVETPKTVDMVATYGGITALSLGVGVYAFGKLRKECY